MRVVFSESCPIASLITDKEIFIQIKLMHPLSLVTLYSVSVKCLSSPLTMTSKKGSQNQLWIQKREQKNTEKILRWVSITECKKEVKIR